MPGRRLARVYRHRVECGEELELVPSHLFYLSGCDLHCVFCIAGINSIDARRGQLLTGDFLSEAIAWGREQGARNIQWVGGEPAVHLPAILDAMTQCRDLPPVVWKSNFHATPEAMRLLDGIVDVYVADFKFGNDACARDLAGVEDYFQTVTANLLLAAQQADLIVRHLLMPGHFDCCYRPVVNWMRRNLPGVKFSIRDGYCRLAGTPQNGVGTAAAGRRVPAGEVAGPRQRVERDHLKERPWKPRTRQR